MSKPSAPPAPDYTGAAQATAAGNLETEKYRTAANRVNQYNPYGSIEYTNTPKTTFDEAGYNKAMAEYTASANPSQYGSGQYSEIAGLPAPDKSKYTTTQDIWSMRQSLSPEQQKLFDQNQQTNLKLGDIAQSGLGYVEGAMANPLSQKIPLTNQVNQMGQLATSAGSPEALQQQMTDAMYNQQAKYLDPQFQQQQGDLENQLANQGITRGSEAWNREMNNASMQKEQAYNQARNSAVGQGMQAAQGMFGMNAQNAQLRNSAIGQDFGMGMQNAGLQNQTSAQQLAQDQTLRNDPVNMLNAVRTGQQMQVAQMPQQQNFAQQGQVAGADLLGAAQATGQYNQGMYNSQAAGQSGMMGSIGAIGGGIIGGMYGGPMGAAYGASAGSAAGRGLSDPRTKENVALVGKYNNLNVYQWTYKPEFEMHELGGVGIQTGYMANEVEAIYPEAIEYADGYKVVNYAMLESLNG